MEAIEYAEPIRTFISTVIDHFHNLMIESPSSLRLLRSVFGPSLHSRAHLDRDWSEQIVPRIGGFGRPSGERTDRQRTDSCNFRSVRISKTSSWPVFFLLSRPLQFEGRACFLFFWSIVCYSFILLCMQFFFRVTDD